MSVNYKVPKAFTIVDQGNSNLCWLATTTMLLSWKSQLSMDMKATAKRLGPEFEALLAKGEALSQNNFTLFLKRSGLIGLVGQSRPAKVWEQLLKTHGLLAVGVDTDAPNNAMAHLVVLQEIVGDESLDGTRFNLIDPNGGVSKSVTFRQFGALYGADDAVNIDFNVFHCT